VENLPDIRTERDGEVELPPFLLEKWEEEGRLEEELAELDEFFEATLFPRAPRYYIMKWLLDYIRDFGVDGYRVDTGRHVEESVWAELNELAGEYFREWKRNHPEKVLDDNEFFIMGEMYGYGVSSMEFDFGDRKVNYFDYGFNNLINFEFRDDVAGSFEDLFRKYSEVINGSHKDYGAVNYVCSHDDSESFDRERSRSLESGTKLLLSPGTAQVYYGDETARLLIQEGAEGDANLRSFMNWDELEADLERNGNRISEVHRHWQKLGQFRKHHPSVGAGRHEMMSEEPYLFKRTLTDGEFSDRVLVGLGLEAGELEIYVEGLFAEGEELMDWYSGESYRVRNGRVNPVTDAGIILLGSPPS
jgi:alpha-amylase